MPHLIIEYPQDIVEEEVEEMLDKVHGAAVSTSLFEENHIRIRAIPLTHYRAGGKRESFIHVQCHIHDGRTDIQKRKLSETILSAIRKQGLEVKVITVEVMEMDRASYAKYSE